MSHRVSALALCLIAAAATLPARTPPPQSGVPASMEARWLRALDSWEAGRYPAALADLHALMKSSAAAEYFERVALLTGELYVTTVLTTDGRNPRIAGNGAYASYEAGAAGGTVTRIVRLGASPQTVGELPATNVAFDRSGRRLAWLKTGSDAASSEIMVRDLASGTDRSVAGPGLLKTSIVWSGDDKGVIFVGADPADASRSDLYLAVDGAPPARLTDQPGHKTNPMVDSRGVTLAFSMTAQSPFTGGGGRGGGRAGGGGRGGAGRGGGGTTYTLMALDSKASRTVTGTGLTLSANGATAAWLGRDGDTTSINALGNLPNALNASGAPTVVRSGRERMDALALSPDGRQLAYQAMTHTDWEIYVASLDGPAPVHRRLTRDIQHDLLPRFLSDTAIIGLKGEARHRRSHLYDLTTGKHARLFSNNTIRTISPEYVWTPSADGRFLILQAERDGDTVSTERDISVIDLTRKVSMADLLARLDRQLAEENELRQRMTAAFKPLDAQVRQALDKAAINRVYEYEKSLVDFDSKHITQPGNLKAIEYLERTYRSFGYDPELQWFTPAALQASGGRTANVVATLRGAVNPELIYVISSHFDSVTAGPGADDDTSGTAALLETARMLAGTPLPATVVFASFTGEEAGLLGSREFVRRAIENKWTVVGALNNDMIGWAADSSQINNTIRYSNPGIRDIQHGASFLFTDLVLFDAKYYKSTDAAAFYDGWGDIVGGIGSYPVLANPNYHQSTDFIETMSFKQIMETAKVTAATIIRLASSPSRVTNVQASRGPGGVEVTWSPSPETGVTSYVVAYGPETDPLRTRITVTTARATLPVVPAGTRVAVKAVNTRGLDGWDWARITVQ